MKFKGIRASSNLKMLEIVARRLGSLNDEVVYVGGCATALIINDPRSMVFVKQSMWTALLRLLHIPIIINSKINYVKMDLYNHSKMM